MSLEKKIYREWAFTGNESEKASTSKMAARPYVEKIKEKALPEIESIFSEDS